MCASLVPPPCGSLCGGSYRRDRTAQRKPLQRTRRCRRQQDYKSSTRKPAPSAATIPATQPWCATAAESGRAPPPPLGRGPALYVTFRALPNVPYATCSDVRESSCDGAQASRLLANLIVAGGGVLFRAASQAYRQAIVSELAALYAPTACLGSVVPGQYVSMCL